jgi:ribonuclease BN (tRNA processing enzyme)
MLLQCLGSGDAFGSGGRCQTSFYLKTASAGILLDCGASTLIALKRQRLSAGDIDIILITHLHGDHFGGLPFILCEILAMGQRKKSLTIIGPTYIKERSEEALKCFYPGFDITKDALIRFVTYRTNEKFELNLLTITAYKAIHSPETHPHILRIETDDTTITYSGDTEWTEDLVTASAGADLLICEASSFQKKLKYHLSVKEIIENENRIMAKKIVLTHLGEEALAHLDEIPFAVARDGEVVWSK